MIKKADKGSAIVVMNCSDYVMEGVRQLRDTTFYQKLDQAPLSDHQREIENTLLKIHQKGEISRKVLHHLLPSGTTTPEFYFLPKIHKANTTGHPIISGNNSLTEHISAFVDEHIKILAPLIKSYIRDTPDFIRNIEEFRQAGHYFLVTMDVTSPYTNIPNHEGLVAVARSLINEQPRFDYIPITAGTTEICTIQEQFQVQRGALLTNRWHGHGHQSGTFPGQPLHETPWKKSY